MMRWLFCFLLMTAPLLAKEEVVTFVRVTGDAGSIEATEVRIRFPDTDLGIRAPLLRDKRRVRTTIRVPAIAVTGERVAIRMALLRSEPVARSGRVEIPIARTRSGKGQTVSLDDGTSLRLHFLRVAADARPGAVEKRRLFAFLQRCDELDVGRETTWRGLRRRLDRFGDLLSTSRRLRHQSENPGLRVDLRRCDFFLKRARRRIREATWPKWVWKARTPVERQRVQDAVHEDLKRVQTLLRKRLDLKMEETPEDLGEWLEEAIGRTPSAREPGCGTVSVL